MAESGNRRVGLAYPHDRFEHGVSGVDPITREGVEVPAGKLAAVKKAARDHGVPLVEGDEVEAQTPQPEAGSGAGG